MKGSSLILSGLAPSVQSQPQQQASHFSASTILASQFQSYRCVQQHTIRRRLQEVPDLDNEVPVEFLGVKHLPSSFYGDGKALKHEIPSSNENFKSVLESYPIRGPKRNVDIQCFSRPFDESDRPRGNYRSRLTQLPANVELNKARGVHAPGELDPSASPSHLDFVPAHWKGTPVPTGSCISEHRSSPRAQETTSSQRAPSPANERPGRRFETIYVVREEPLPTRIATSNFYAKENLRTIEARVESKNVITEQAALANVCSPSRTRVQQAFYEFRDPWRLKKSRMASEPHKREAQSAESYRPVGESFNNFRAATGRGNERVQMETPSPQSRAVAAKWRKAANLIEHNRNPSHDVLGGNESLPQTIDSLNVEPDRAVEKKANRSKSILAKDVLEIRQLESLSRDKEGQSTPISERGVTRYASRDACRDTSQGNDILSIGGSLVQAVAVLQNRLQRGVTTHCRTYVKVLQTCLKQKDLSAAKQVHGCIIQSGMHKNLSVAITLLNVYIRCGALADARQVFDQLEKRSVVTWTNLIAGYTKRNYNQPALELYNQMREEGVKPNEITYLSILKACARPSAIKWGKNIHECIREEGFESDVRVGTALLNMYSKCGCIVEARQVFENLTNRNIITWNVMLGALAQHGHGHEAYRLFLQMRQEGFEPDAFTFSNILNASASVGALEWVKEVHGHVIKAGLESDMRVGNALVHMYAKSGSIDDALNVFERMQKLDVVTYTVMIGALAEHGRGHQAYRLFLQMRQEGCEPDAFTVASILNPSASAGALEWVKEVHGYASKAGLESDMRLGNALVHMYAKSGSIDDAIQVFERMEKRDVVTWNIMIGGLALHGSGHEALELFRKMTADLLKPDETTFVGVLSACCHSGLVDDGQRLFSGMMQDYGIEPSIQHYNCMVDLLGRAGQLEEARLFISNMPIEADAVTWKALLGACRTYGNVELGELAAEEVFKLEPTHPAAYVLLSNIYAAARKWENVSLVRTMMQARGVWKEPGRSWIEVDKKIHEFVVGDTSHPEAKAIYNELNKLTEKLKAEGYIPDTRLVLHDIREEDRELALCSHSEKLAIAYGLLHIPQDEPICVRKNLRVCPDCHTATKLISKVTGREIIARDAVRFHHFRNGVCSCGDYW